jgi:hypothetical protein
MGSLRNAQSAASRGLGDAALGEADSGAAMSMGGTSRITNVYADVCFRFPRLSRSKLVLMMITITFTPRALTACHSGERAWKVDPDPYMIQRT